MIGKLAIKQLKMHFLMNIIILIQLVAILFISILVTSTVVSRFNYYNPFKDYFNQKGLYLELENIKQIDSNVLIESSKELEKYLKKANVISYYNVWLNYEVNNQNMEYSTVAYDQEIIDRYQPELESGRWLQESDNDTSEIEVVISNNKEGVKVGDIINGTDVYSLQPDNKVKIKVVGILKDSTLIYGHSDKYKEKFDYEMLYRNYNLEFEDKPIVLMSKEDIDERMKEQDNYSIERMLSGTTLITYDKDITDEEIEYNENYIYTHSSPFHFEDLPEMNKNSIDYIFSQIYSLLPIVCSVFILTLISSLSTNAIAAKKELKNFSIFYICGLRWKQCILVNVFSSIYLLFGSMIITILCLVFCLKFEIISKSIVSVGPYQLLVCLGISIIYILCSVILPYKIIGDNTVNEFEALHKVSLEIQEGEFVAIVGKSGAGKSTLLHVLANIDSYEDGEYYLDDMLIKDLSEKESSYVRNKKLGIIMQDFALVEQFTVKDNVLLPLDFSKEKVKNKEELVGKALEDVKISELVNKPINKLSGGQKQRVAIARALINNPKLILADEPTGSLDSSTSAEILALLKELNKKGKTIIIVTHDMEIAKQCDRIIEVVDGYIA